MSDVNDKLFYFSYCLMWNRKKQSAKDRAAAFLSLATSFLISSFLISTLSIVNAKEVVISPEIGVCFMVLIFVGSFYWYRRKYYINKYYKKVVEKYEGTISYSKGGIISLLYYVISFSIFIYSMINYQGVTS